MSTSHRLGGVSVVGFVAGNASWLQFGGDGVPGLFMGRVVVEFEELGGLAVDALVVVGF